MDAEIFSIKRFAVHDGDGIRTTVFFKGCPLRCVWCHNPEGLFRGSQLSYHADKCVGCGECAAVCPVEAHIVTETEHVFDRSRCRSCGLCASHCLTEALKLYGQKTTIDELLPVLLEDRDFFESSGGGVTLSGGECLLQADFCSELLKKLKEENISTAVDTCGFVPRSALDAVLPYTDTFLYDIKAYREDTHIRCTGQSNCLILDNLRYLDEKGADIEIRIPYVPRYNSEEMPDISAFLSTLSHVRKVRILPYHNFAGSKYSSLGLPADLPPTLPTEEELSRANAYFKVWK